jgi:hypothetical protein
MIDIIKNNIVYKGVVSSLICMSLLSACGGSGGDSSAGIGTTPDPTPTPTPVVTQDVTITGTAIKGTLISAVVELFNANDLETPIAVTSTGSNGEYELTFTGTKGDNLGTLVIKVSVDDNTTMICDAGDCNGVSNGATLTLAEIGNLELWTHLVIDASQTAQVNVTDLPVNTLTTAATSVLLANTSASELSAMTEASLLDLQQELTQALLAALGVVTDADINLLNINLPDATNIPLGLTNFNVASNLQGLISQLAILNASFAANADINTAISTFSELVIVSNGSEEFSADLITFLTNLRAEYDDLFGLLNSLDGGLPAGITLPDFVQITFPDGNGDGGIIIDPDNTTGDWTLTIVGTVTLTSPITITTDIPPITVNNIAAPSSGDTTEIENIFNEQVSAQGVTVSNLSFTITEETANKVVIEYTATISVTEAGVTVTQTQNLVYTWTK